MGIAAAFMVPHPPMIIPKIGRGDEKKIQDTVRAYEEVADRIEKLRPQTIVLISPHQVMYADYFHISPGKKAQGDFTQFKTSQEKITVKYDEEFVEKLSAAAQAKDVPAGTNGEKNRHLDYGTMVPLHFVNQKWSDYKLVRIGLSGLPLTSHYALGQCIKETAETLGRTAVVIASGDLSHRLKEDGPYGYCKEGPAYDGRMMDIMANARFGELFDFGECILAKAGECGHRSFTIMAGALDRTAVNGERLSYEGPVGVGYGICAYEAGAPDAERNFREKYIVKEEARIAKLKEQEDSYVKLARAAIEEIVLSDKRIGIPEGLDDEFYHEKAGVFVTIKTEGRLRGSMGTLKPEKDSLAEEIIQNALNAAANDPRFLPVKKEELGRIEVIVDVLGEPEKISSPDMLDINRYGVIVSKGCKKGFLLPNQEGLESVGEQVAVAKKNVGLKPTDKVALQRFEVTRH